MRCVAGERKENHSTDGGTDDGDSETTNNAGSSAVSGELTASLESDHKEDEVTGKRPANNR
jgi:hypothetical protein